MWSRAMRRAPGIYRLFTVLTDKQTLIVKGHLAPSLFSVTFGGTTSVALNMLALPHWGRNTAVRGHRSQRPWSGQHGEALRRGARISDVAIDEPHTGHRAG